MLDGLIDASKRDLPAVLARGDVESRGVTGWMLALGKLFANPKRLAILLRLEEQDTSMADLAELLDIDLSNVSRHLSGLRKSGVVAERFVGFNRGPRKVACVTQIGQQLLDGLREVALQIVRTQFKDVEDRRLDVRSQSGAGRVNLHRGVFIGILEELERFLRWQVLFGLLSESQFYDERRRLLKIASGAGVDWEWLRQLERESSRGKKK